MKTCSCFGFRLRDGRTIFGAVQGAGGILRQDGLRRIQLAIADRRAASLAGGPGVLLVYREWSAKGPGPATRLRVEDIASVIEAPTLTDELSNAGYSHRKASMGQHTVCDRDGTAVFVGRAHEVWSWLRNQRVLEELAEIQRDAETVAEAVERRAG